MRNIEEWWYIPFTTSFSVVCIACLMFAYYEMFEYVTMLFDAMLCLFVAFGVVGFFMSG